MLIKPLIIWGYILLIGFSLNYYFAMMDLSAYYFYGLWIVLAIIGIVGTIVGRPTREKSDKRIGITWITLVILGLILTALIVSRVWAISLYYIMSIWLILMGVAVLIQSNIIEAKATSLIGIAWIVVALVLILMPSIGLATLVVGGTTFGASMIAWGATKEIK